MKFITWFFLLATAILAAPAAIFDPQSMDPKALAAVKTCGGGTGYCSSGHCYCSNYCEVGYCPWSPCGNELRKEQHGAEWTHDMRGCKEGVNRSGDL
ncbi:hypothetical protein NEUTE1DRAFT_97301 [Neurospora tetrasperma FGSC 2508]|uniref:Uncharacterized protein n=1 Tax=Neurospora tetrasperma (strain FGSC 2508 / ATCC MYA-4615 / P0657) TaxID=510951 RepID=F8MF30_NEUT8|nr:uncharacterized protein NEUTE1DRAFT_97301 [Neurospora tetrasperma FGSC 2508]EGO60082.1 hypothetical protein NEUTE1DRAFT_97301 [Neurospora tetrasperma FGSC 2508]